MDVKEKDIGVGLTPKEMIEVLLYCNCEGSHQGRPEGVLNGCGAFGKVKFSR
jgi:hypothetical protein